MAIGEDRWSLTRETIGDGRLSVILDASSREAVEGLLSGHGIAAECVVPDLAAYGSRAAALRAAFDSTSGEYVFEMDGACRENAELLPEYFREMSLHGADVVVGSKTHPDSRVDYPLARRFLGRIYHFFVRHFIGLPLSDVNSGVKLFRRGCFEHAVSRMLSKTNAFDLEMLAIAHSAGAKLAEAPVVVGSGEHFTAVGPKAAWPLVNDTLAVFYRLRLLGYYEKCLVPKKLDHDPLVSIVIACPGRSWMLDECLAAISRQTYRNFETIVLDDERTGKVRPAEKRNLGIAEAKGEIIAFIDDDAYPDEHWLEYAVKYFGEPSIGAVGGPAVTPPGDRNLARVGGKVYENLLVSGNYRYRYKIGGVRKDVEDYPSCNLFVRKSLLEKIGGYRTDFWPGEDTLLCKDILDSWKRIVYDPWVIVYHHRRPLFMPHLRQLGRYGFHRGYFTKRYPSNSLRFSYFVPTIFVVYLVACAAVAPFFWPAAIPLAVYWALVALTCADWRPDRWLLAMLGVFASHVWYGLRFAQGMLAAKAPCEYIGEDHANGNARNVG